MQIVSRVACASLFALLVNAQESPGWFSSGINASHQVSAAAARESSKVKEKAQKNENAFQTTQSGAQRALSDLERLRVELAHNFSEEAINSSLHLLASREEELFVHRRGSLKDEFVRNATAAEQAVAVLGNNRSSSSAATAARREASEALSSMRRLDNEMRRAEREYILRVRRGTDKLSDEARHQARRAEKEGNRLARRARRFADRLDGLARKENVDDLRHLDDGVDALERSASAEDAERKLSDEVEVGTRHADDLGRMLADGVEHDVEAKVDMHQEARDSAITRVAESMAAVQDTANAPSSTLLAGWTFLSALAGGMVAAAALSVTRTRSRAPALQETLLA